MGKRVVLRLLVGCAVALGVFVAGSGVGLAAGKSGSVTVYAGPPLQKPPAGISPHADALFFYPRSVTINVGDTVTWQLFGFHTVTFAGSHHPYPFAAPAGKQAVTKDAAGQPFWWSGKAPVLAISPLAILQQGGSTISSRADVRSSGLMRVLSAGPKSPPAPYQLTFTSPGIYHYQCAVHTGMRGVVIVRPAGQGTPSVASEAAAVQAALARTIADLRQIQQTKPKRSSTVFVGAGHASTGAEVTAFFPAQLSVHVGDTVTFVNHDQTDIHTVTFGPEKLRANIEKNFAAPQGKRLVLNPLGAFPSDPPGGAVEYNGANHGNGYLSAGILQPQGAPAAAGPKMFQVTFTKPGTYHYECVIHSNMDGTIVVH